MTLNIENKTRNVEQTGERGERGERGETQFVNGHETMDKDNSSIVLDFDFCS